MSNDMQSLLLNLPKPLILIDPTTQEVVLANKESQLLLSIDEGPDSTALVTHKLKQKIFSSYNYLEGLGDTVETINNESKIDLKEALKDNN